MHVECERKIYKLFHTRESKLYAFFGVRSFVLSLIGIFVPIFILKQGFSILELIYFYAFYYSFSVLAVIISLKLFEKLGYPKMFVLSSFFYFLFFSLFPNVHSLPELMGIGIFCSLAVSFFWIPFNILFAKAKEDKLKVACKQNVTGIIATALAPLVGGILATMLPNYILFYFSAFTFILAPLALFKHERIKHRRDGKKISITLEKIKRYRIFVYEGFLKISTFIAWPLFIYFLFSSISVVGLVKTLTNLVIVILSVKIVHWVKGSKERLLDFSNKLYSSTLFLRPLAFTYFLAFTVSLLIGFGTTIFNIAYNAFFYEKLSKKIAKEFLFIRELLLSLGRVIALSLFGILMYFKVDPILALTVLLILGSISAYYLKEIRDI